MGIPSYFSHIIQTHKKILNDYAYIIRNDIQFNRLYMDCNSILYDVFHNTDQSCSIDVLYKTIIQNTIKKIEIYIKQIKPSDCIYIAFDGVAPMAKMQQQRTRRYKSWFESSICKSINQPTNTTTTQTNLEKTTCIFTPGTKFMQQLSVSVQEHFNGNASNYNVKNIIVATPDYPGEGEHKLYAHLRENPCLENETSIIYGLDADLLMLSLLHLEYSKSMYVFREAPQFKMLKLSDGHSPDEPLFLDIAKLGECVSNTMVHNTSGMFNMNRLKDYVFICFFLGNDFLPHFPSMNIRTHGIDALLDVYRNEIGSEMDQYLLNGKTNAIQWKILSRFVRGLAKCETIWLRQEYSVRDKWDRRYPETEPKKTVKEKMDLFSNTPVLYRAVEKTIDVNKKKWQQRYYRTLFPPKVSILGVCQSYLEGLQWVTQYYCTGKVDWDWYYPYHYPPLLEDLAPKIPQYETEFLRDDINTKPVHPYTQLCYVLPPVYHFLLPESIQKRLSTKYSQYYVGPYNNDHLPQLKFEWAYCRYFWESHVYLPNIPIKVIQEWDIHSYEIDK